MSTTLCYCHSGKLYHSCCQPFHDGIATAPNALVLMRSRYSAYACGKAQYIIDTTDPEGSAYQTPLTVWKTQIDNFANTTQFAGLTIINFDEEGDQATVTFVAHLQQGEHDRSFKETSQFYRRARRWLYHSGEFVAITTQQ